MNTTSNWKLITDFSDDYTYIRAIKFGDVVNYEALQVRHDGHGNAEFLHTVIFPHEYTRKELSEFARDFGYGNFEDYVDENFSDPESVQLENGEPITRDYENYYGFCAAIAESMDGREISSDEAERLAKRILET